ncbi:MAG: 1-deoxy-D-xylulose-5-phosphate synthase [Candidatus Hydrogenedentota bacterium]
MASHDTSKEASDLAEQFPRLAKLKSPDDLKSLPIEELSLIAEDVRQCIIHVAARNGGHLASPLGAVEMSVAMHYVYEFPEDFIVWDVGHQAHAHKILTGRFDQFHTLRRKGGLSGYPSRSESEFDHFGTGHSSTSISAALGMVTAADYKGETERNAIAVIGDGAMTGGMAFEALSHGGHLNKNILVVLNDNDMSISKNVGALSTYLSRLITGGLYNKTKGDIKSLLEHTLGKHFTEGVRRVEHHIKGMIVPATIFEELGFRYFGPIDGNDLPTLIECFRNIREFHKPILLHCVTQKGKGLPYAEEDPLTYHGVGPYDIETGTQHGPAPKTDDVASFTEAFVSALIEVGKQDDKVVAITAAMPTGTGLSKFEKVFPERFYDVGICEQHAVTFAAGLATQGLRPVAAIYSTFLQRGYDQYIHDVCLQNLPVVFAIDRAGLVGEDSPTQQGAFDLSFLRAIPNITLLAPRDNEDLRLCLHWCLKQDVPTAFRYARTKGPTIGRAKDRDITRGEILREGTDAYFLSTGPIASTCLQVAEALQDAGVSIGVADARYIKPLDTELINSIAHMPIITVEENTLAGGFGSAVMEFFEEQGRLHDIRIRRIGIPDRFLPHATRAEQLEDAGLGADSLERVARDVLADLIIQPEN